MRRQLTSGAAAAALALGGLVAVSGPATAEVDEPVAAGITVPKVENLPADFMNGVDVSSILSLEESGVTFTDFDGREADLFDVMADAGINYVRIRVWNDPYLSTDATKGYGGGNVDPARATEIGKRATAAGMKVLVDFHYADFWAHPGQQPVPKAWVGMTAAEKADALYAFTQDTLQMMADEGVDVGMVQIGNETSNLQLSGESWPASAPLFDAGSRAVRDTLGGDVRIAVHFTNPERGNYGSLAASLASYDTDPATDGVQPIDYDVFASSYYAYWHGTLENLTAQLQGVADTYGKDVIVAETSWNYTLEDGDGWENTIREATRSDKYSSTVQGQALAVRDVIDATVKVGDAGLGVFYWEPAWLPVGAPDQLAANQALWEEFGSGWASSYAGEYSTDAGTWYGGSSWDNQALFDFEGHPLESLRVFDYARYGTVAPREVDAIGAPSLTVIDGDPITLPSTVSVAYTDGTSEDQPVTWGAKAEWIVGPGTYEVPGTTADGFATTATVTVLGSATEGVNLVVNPGFEDGVAPWTGTGSGYTISASDDPHDGSTRSTHFYSGSAFSFTIEQEITGVPAGDYRLSAFAQGRTAVDGEHTYITVSSGIASESADFTLANWTNWQNPVTDVISVVEGATVTVSATFDLTAGAWGTIDDFQLVAESESAVADTAALEAAIAAGGGYDAADHTAASFLDLTRALARGEFILESSAPGQASVDAATGAILAAIDGLEDGDGTIPAPTVDPVSIAVVLGDAIELPGTVTVRAYDDTTSTDAVTWADVLDLITSPGTYPVPGVTAGGLDAVATVTVAAPVLIANGGFEKGDSDVTPWELVANPWPDSTVATFWVTGNGPHEGSYSLNLWNGYGADIAVSATQEITGLAPGDYRLTAQLQGGGTHTLALIAGDRSVPVVFGAWDAWMPHAVEVTVGADGTLVVGLAGDLTDGAWGFADDFVLEPLDGPVAGDTAALEAALADAAGVDRAVHTAESLAVLDLAVARARVVLGADAPAQVALDAATVGVEDALAALEIAPADVEELAAVLAVAEAVARPLYTPASLRHLDQAVDAAEPLLAASALDQGAVDAAADAVSSAVTDLVLKPQFEDRTPPGLAKKG
ncbi:glycosyl hydrolase 53 family protein [Demequina lignilytica]|uniref:Arabinogalactan endo-beta-1,4-galactanase n=1 Tax=Demequina lignilytica TaxID=3051663 RepID=A0AB35MKA0_9MICO|nr:glycosyl hydrolase 53 family protein [Demequina sp. SYSU T0a273]MDN4484125.1 glycosyl hydrolase 53 family protein [Demequina sp. SYSU T0a273]